MVAEQERARVPGPLDVAMAAEVHRRGVLTASALGITTLALPGATAAASTLSFEPAAASYDAADALVAAWLPFDTDADVYGGPGVAADGILTGLTAHLTQAGTTVSRGNLNPVDPEITAVDSSSYSEWAMRNSSQSLDLAASPHLQFSVGVTSGTLQLATLVLHSVRNMAGGDNTELANLAAYVSTDGFVTSTLRRTASIGVGVSFRHIVINLGLSSQTLTSGQTATVRVYPYAMPNARNVRFAPYNSDPAPGPLVGSLDALDPTRVNAQIGATGPNWIAGFVGRYVA